MNEWMQMGDSSVNQMEPHLIQLRIHGPQLSNDP